MFRVKGWYPPTRLHGAVTRWSGCYETTVSAVSCFGTEIGSLRILETCNAFCIACRLHVWTCNRNVRGLLLWLLLLPRFLLVSADCSDYGIKAVALMSQHNLYLPITDCNELTVFCKVHYLGLKYAGGQT